MVRTTWNAYDKFCCIADKCTDSCCQGWEVDVDEETAAVYRTMEGSLGDRLRRVLKTEDGSTSMILEKGRCPMWRQDGLCRIQAEKGHDALCQVCREYPRLYMDYGDFAEWGLEMSCPEAARLLFADMSATEQAVPGGGEPEYDGEVMAVLQESRREILKYWENPEPSVADALAVTLIYAHEIQSAIDGGDRIPFDPDACLAVSRKVTSKGDFPVLIEFFMNLEILTDDWKDWLDHPQMGHWDSELRQFAKYLIRRYWYQAVWDYDLVCRAKLIVAACILVNAGDTVRTAQLFAKENENDPENRNAILDAAYTHPAFTDKNLLGLLKA